MDESVRSQISDLITRIEVVRPTLEVVTNSLSTKLSTFSEVEAEEQAIVYWRMQALRDALVRIGTFIERNFSYIETLGLISLCRYTFELVVWLKHIELDERFALIYAQILCKQQVELYEKLAGHLQREIDLYLSLAEEETIAHANVRAAARTQRTAGRATVEDIRAASNLIDERLALEFAIYSDQALHNGYGFQAHLLKTQALQKAVAYADENRIFLAKFNSRWAKIIEELKIKDWKWYARAKHVGMDSDYDFIYSYTSRLLHATPASLTTHQQSLEEQEIAMFLRYIAIQFRWIVRHGEERVVQLRHH